MVNVSKVELIEVISVMHCEGSGEAANPFRTVISYYSKGGELLAESDLWLKEGVGLTAAKKEEM